MEKIEKMKIARLNAYSVSLALITMLFVSAGSVVASANSIVVNGDFSSLPGSSTVPIGDGAWAGSSAGEPITWAGGSNYAYDPTNISGWTFSPSTASGATSWVNGGIAQYGSAFGFTSAPGNSPVAFLQTSNFIPGCCGSPGWLTNTGGTTGSGATMSQTLNGLIQGDIYQVVFYEEGRSEQFGPNPVTVSVGGSVFLPATTQPPVGWQEYSGDFTASSSSEILAFSTGDIGTDQTSGITDIAVNSTGNYTSGATPLTSPAPEPSSLLLLGTGLFGLACVAFRKAKASDLVLQS